MRLRTTISALVLALTLGLCPPAAALEPDHEEPHHLRMLLETGTYLLFGTLWYFSGQDLNAPDWDLTITGEDLKLKFFGITQIRLDNNSFLFNQAYHPLAHGGIYLTARANDMGPALAFAYTFLSSAFWEYVGELREKVSINDMIVSPMTGMAWGEVAYQYGEYFASAESRGHPFRRRLTGFVGIPRTFHDWLDKESATVFEEPRFHVEPRIALVSGLRQYEAGALQPLTTVEIASTMAVMPGFGLPGKRTESFRDGNFSRLDGQFQFTADQTELDLDATATVAGLYQKDISVDGTGVEFMVGGGRGYRFVSRQGTQFDDRVALAHLFGPTGRLILHGPGSLKVDIGVEAFFDFSAIRSLVLPKLVSTYGEQVLDEVRTDIQKQGYYFGWGFTFSPTIAVEAQRLRLELGTNISRVHSIQGLDRFEEDVTRVIILDDLVFDTRAALVVPFNVDWLDLRVQAHVENRRSQIDKLSAKNTYREVQVGLQSRF